jgi:hypothetical protein
MVMFLAVAAMISSVVLSTVFVPGPQFVDVSPCRWTTRACDMGVVMGGISTAYVVISEKNSNLSFCVFRKLGDSETLGCAVSGEQPPVTGIVFSAMLSLNSYRLLKANDYQTALTAVVGLSVSAAIGMLLLVGGFGFSFLRKAESLRRDRDRERERRERRKEIVMILLAARMKQQVDSCCIAQLDMFTLERIIQAIDWE